jgi:hypothetical protein
MKLNVTEDPQLLMWLIRALVAKAGGKIELNHEDALAPGVFGEFVYGAQPNGTFLLELKAPQ